MSLEEVLRFREKKALLQEKMIRENPGAVIVSLGMNIPGPVKSGPMIYAAFREGLERLEELSEKKKGMRTVKVLMEEAAGYAAVCLTKEQDPYSVKRAAIRLEESHPLGRLWPLDAGHPGCTGPWSRPSVPMDERCAQHSHGGNAPLPLPRASVRD